MRWFRRLFKRQLHDVSRYFSLYSLNDIPVNCKPGLVAFYEDEIPSKYYIRKDDFKLKEEPKMKCKSCSVELDVKLDYCASCVGKGFDLRPFEVKKEPKKYYKVLIYGIPNPTCDFDNFSYHTFGLAKDIDSLPLMAREAFAILPSQQHVSFEKHIIIEERDDLSEETTWTFEDIKVGCFFKVTTQTYEYALECKSICLKLTKDTFSWVYHYEMMPGYVDNFLIMSGMVGKININTPALYKFKITNVYDCQELAKVLMIERIIT